MCSSSTLFLSPSVETANICCCLLLFHVIPFQPAISHFLLCCPRTGLQKYLLEWGIFTDQGEALSTLVQSPPRVTEVLWWIIHPETWESYHIISMDHISWSDKGLLADPHFGLAATDLCYNPTESHLFPVCNLSQNNICEEHNLAVGFQLSVSCLCNTFPAFRLPLHLAKWVFIMQTLHSLETRMNLQPYSKGQLVLFTMTLSCIQSKTWKWGKSTIHPGHFCWSALQLLLKETQHAATHLYSGNSLLLWECPKNASCFPWQPWACMEQIVSKSCCTYSCSLWFTTHTCCKTNSKKQQRSARALTDARFYLHGCYSLVSCS